MLDTAIKLRPQLMTFLKQPPEVSEPIESTLQTMQALATQGA